MKRNEGSGVIWSDRLSFIVRRFGEVGVGGNGQNDFRKLSDEPEVVNSAISMKWRGDHDVGFLWRFTLTISSYPGPQTEKASWTVTHCSQ